MGWQEDLPEKTQEFLTEFGKNFAKYYAVAMVQKAQRQKNSPEDTRKLMYRDWDCIEADPRSLKKGNVFVREGEGAGSWGGWKQRFLVQRQDHNIDAFSSEKDYEKSPQKPEKTIKLAGYTLVTNTQEFYLEDGRKTAADIGGSDPEVGFSSYSWALAHPTRPQFMFQLHKGKSAACGCIGGNAVEPEDAGAEFADEKEEWVAVFKECLAQSCPRNIDTELIADAFERLKNKMCCTIPELEGQNLDGTEGEILTDMMYLCILEVSVKPDIIEQLNNLPPAFKLPAWIKAKGASVKMMSSAVPPAWKKIQEQMQAFSDKVEPSLMDKLEIIFEVKDKIKGKIIDGVGGKLGEAVGSKVSPHLKKMFDAMDAPLKDGLKEGKKVFEEKSKQASGMSPADRKRYLDGIPRDPDNVKEVKVFASNLTDPLEKLKDADSETFQDLDPEGTKCSAEHLMLEILDAACHTLDERLNQDDAPDFDTCLEDVIKDYEKDIVDQRATWMKDTINGIVKNLFARTVGSLVDEFLEPLLSEIPEDLNEFFDIKAEFDSIMYGILAEAIDKFVDGAYPPK